MQNESRVFALLPFDVREEYLNLPQKEGFSKLPGCRARLKEDTVCFKSSFLNQDKMKPAVFVSPGGGGRGNMETEYSAHDPKH